MGLTRRRERTITQQDLAKEVGVVLGIPIHAPRSNKAYRLVRTIIRVMAKALLNGEEIYIAGFGRFHLYHRGALRRNANLHGTHYQSYDIIIPPKTILTFKPALPLLRLINQEPQEP